MKLTDTFSTNKVRQVKDKKEMECPKCGKSVRMEIIKTKDGLGFSGKAITNVKSSAYCVCPECFALFAVEAKAGANLVNTGNYDFLTADKLIFLKDIPYRAK